MNSTIFSPSMKVALFVDVQNLYYGSKQQYNSRVDYAALLEWVMRGRSLIRAIAYIVESEDNDQTGFKNSLRAAGFEVMSKQLIRRQDGSSKGNWDIAIAVDAMTIAPKVDAVVIASGDGDFMYLAEYLRNNGCRVEAVGFESSTSRLLSEAVHEFRNITPDICTYDTKPSRRQPTR